MRGLPISVDRPQDFLRNALGISQNVIIPESQNDVSHGLKAFGSVGIAGFIFIVLTTVELDDELHILTNEINDKPVDRRLAIEFQTCESAITQAKP